MKCKILLTSFQTWLPAQISNSSDDLVEIILEQFEQFESCGISLIGLRQLPVKVNQAAGLAIAKITELKPDAIICCGMAESRSKLTIESGATSAYLSSSKHLSLPYLSRGEMFNFPPVEYFYPQSLNTTTTHLIKTSVDLEKLIMGLTATEISHDAGKFVCEGLYYQILNYLQEQKLNSSCIFVHVPVLTAANLPSIRADFQMITQKMAAFAQLGVIP